MNDLQFTRLFFEKLQLHISELFLSLALHKYVLDDDIKKSIINE